MENQIFDEKLNIVNQLFDEKYKTKYMTKIY